MKEKFMASGCSPADRQRSADEIRKDIKNERETISQTVGSLGDKLQNAMDWRAYVRRAPFVSVGAAAGLGAMISVLLTKRKSPMDRIMESAVRSTKRASSRSLLSLGMYTVITKVLADIAKTTAFDIVQGKQQPGGHADRPDTIH